MGVTLFLIMAVLVVLGALGVAYGANQRKRARQTDNDHVQAQQQPGGGGKPSVGRATGLN